MPLIINRTNNSELETRRIALIKQLVDRLSFNEGEPITRSDLGKLACAGSLTVYERELYDELRRVEMLLDVDE